MKRAFDFYGIQMTKEFSIMHDVDMSNPAAAIDVMGNYICDRTQEFTVLMPLDVAGRPVGGYILSIGTETATKFSMSSLLRAVLASGCVNFIMMHNHPSGVAKPSPGDVRMCDAVIDACSQVGLFLVDNIIAGRDKKTGEIEYYSMRAHHKMKILKQIKGNKGTPWEEKLEFQPINNTKTDCMVEWMEEDNSVEAFRDFYKTQDELLHYLNFGDDKETSDDFSRE